MTENARDSLPPECEALAARLIDDPEAAMHDPEVAAALDEHAALRELADSLGVLAHPLKRAGEEEAAVVLPHLRRGAEKVLRETARLRRPRASWWAWMSTPIQVSLPRLALAGGAVAAVLAVGLWYQSIPTRVGRLEFTTGQVLISGAERSHGGRPRVRAGQTCEVADEGAALFSVGEGLRLALNARSQAALVQDDYFQLTRGQVFVATRLGAPVTVEARGTSITGSDADFQVDLSSGHAVVEVTRGTVKFSCYGESADVTAGQILVGTTDGVQEISPRPEGRAHPEWVTALIAPAVQAGVVDEGEFAQD